MLRGEGARGRAPDGEALDPWDPAGHRPEMGPALLWAHHPQEATWGSGALCVMWRPWWDDGQLPRQIRWSR